MESNIRKEPINVFYVPPPKSLNKCLGVMFGIYRLEVSLVIVTCVTNWIVINKQDYLCRYD